MAKSRTVHVKDLERGEAEQRREYGGFNWGAAFLGWLVATSVGILLTSLLAAAGSAITLTTVDNTNELTGNAETIGIVSGIILLLSLGVAYYAGGYVAGRMSRFDGGRQGLGVWILGILITLLLGLAGAAFGANYNLFQQLNLPHIPVDAGSFTTGGIITLLFILAVTLLAAISGGKVGERYHRKVDNVARDERGRV